MPARSSSGATFRPWRRAPCRACSTWWIDTVCCATRACYAAAAAPSGDQRVDGRRFEAGLAQHLGGVLAGPRRVAAQLELEAAHLHRRRHLRHRPVGRDARCRPPCRASRKCASASASSSVRTGDAQQPAWRRRASQSASGSVANSARELVAHAAPPAVHRRCGAAASGRAARSRRTARPRTCARARRPRASGRRPCGRCA